MGTEASSFIDPASYDNAERLAMAALPNRIIECCQPNVFQWEGYPTRVDSVAGIRRFVDVMHEGRLKGTFEDILGGGVTSEEMDLMREVAQIVRNLSEERLGGAIVPKDALARALNVYRQIRILYPDTRPVVLEVGGGSGYLGALLLLSGYALVATDVTQAFYLFQNYLMNAVAPGKVIELAIDPRSFEEITNVPQGWAVHVPWWKFVLPEPDFPLPVDVVSANHCLCEMHPRALAYTLKTCSRLLDNAGSESCFVFEGWGSTTRNPIWSVSKKFADLGYGIAHNDTLASVWVRTTASCASGGVTFPKPQPQTLIRGGAFGPNQTARQRIFKTLFGSATNLANDSILVPTPSQEDFYHPPIWITAENPLSRRIMEGRARCSQSATQGLADWDRMIKEILGKSDTATDDEKFLRYVDASL